MVPLVHRFWGRLLATDIGARAHTLTANMGQVFFLCSFSLERSIAWRTGSLPETISCSRDRSADLLNFSTVPSEQRLEHWTVTGLAKKCDDDETGRIVTFYMANARENQVNESVNGNYSILTERLEIKLDVYGEQKKRLLWDVGSDVHRSGWEILQLAGSLENRTRGAAERGWSNN